MSSLKKSVLAVLAAVGAERPALVSLLEGAALASLFVVLTLLLFWKHSENIKRLQSGTEGRIGA
mgnify:CR=1 FL=1